MNKDSLLTQSSIIRKVQMQDESAWGQFVDLYAPLIFNWCQQSSLTKEDSADITQIVFAKLHRKIGQYKKNGQSNFRSWLWVVTRNTIRDYCRKQAGGVEAVGGTECQHRIESLPDEFEDEPTSNSAENQLYRRALSIIESNIESKTWQAFWRVTMEGEDSSQVAEDLGLSANGVRQAKSRVLRRLRDLLEG